MFCYKCGKEISNYETCSSPVSNTVTPSHFDQKTGEQWFYLYYSGFSCKKWNHEPSGFGAQVMMKKANIPSHNKNETNFVSGKHVTDNVLIIGKCGYTCCPFCGYAPDKSGCFIATAVYGSSSQPEVLVFRRFRDEILIESKLGLLLVRFYYLISPPLAKLILRYKIINVVTRRILLEPFLKVLNERFLSTKRDLPNRTIKEKS